MSKKEQLEKEIKLGELESTVVSNFAINNGSLFRAAETLLIIKKGDLFKAVKLGGKMVYRTFKAYLDHFELDAAHRKLLEKLISFHEFMIDSNLQEIAPCLPSNDTFWSNFMKIKIEYWKDAIKFLGNIPSVTVDDITSFFEKTPEAKVGYSSERKLPSPTQIILANAKKLNSKSIVEFIMRGTDEPAFSALYEAVKSAKENIDDVSIVSVDNKLVRDKSSFTIVKEDGKNKATEATPKAVSVASFCGTLLGLFAIGYVIGRVLEFCISKLF